MRAIDDPGWFNYHKILAQDMLVVVISVVFAVVAPIVLIPCAVFCFLSRIVWTHQFLYVYESAFETGGRFWRTIQCTIMIFIPLRSPAFARSVLAKNLPAVCLRPVYIPSYNNGTVHFEGCSARGLRHNRADDPHLHIPALHSRSI